MTVVIKQSQKLNQVVRGLVTSCLNVLSNVCIRVLFGAATHIDPQPIPQTEQAKIPRIAKIYSIHTASSSITYQSVVAQITILKPEVTLLPHAPAPLPVKVEILSLLVLVCHLIGLGVPLEPC